MEHLPRGGERRAARAALALRIRQVSEERFGAEVGALAERLGIPARTWENYEAGVAMPAEVALDFLAVTGADPNWLRTGRGERYAGR